MSNFSMLRFKYTTKFSLPKIACPAIVYAEIVVVIDPFYWALLSIAECKSGFATEQNPVPVDTLLDEMASSPLHIGKPVTSRHCLTF